MKDQTELIGNMLNHITWKDICEAKLVDNRIEMLFKEFEPKKYEEFIKVVSYALNTYAWEDDSSDSVDLKSLKNMLGSEEFQKYPCFAREDVTEHLVSAGFSLEDALVMSEMVRKGYAHSEYCYKYDKLPLPSDIKKVTSYFKYLTFRERVEKMVGYLVSYTYERAFKIMCIEYNKIYSRPR